VIYLKLTTIQLEKETLEKLRTFKEYSKESYNEVIIKLMKLKQMIEPELTEQAKSDIAEARKEKSVPLSEAIRKLGVDVEL